jgi:ActR/RegA family two-component response regulator
MLTPEHTQRVLIVSSHPIFAKTLDRLVREAGYQVMACVAALPQALPLLQANAPVTVIIEYQDAQPRADEWLPLLQSAHATRRVILLTLAKNEMIVHEQRRVTHVTETELKQAL